MLAAEWHIRETHQLFANAMIFYRTTGMSAPSMNSHRRSSTMALSQLFRDISYSDHPTLWNSSLFDSWTPTRLTERVAVSTDTRVYYLGTIWWLVHARSHSHHNHSPKETHSLINLVFYYLLYLDYNPSPRRMVLWFFVSWLSNNDLKIDVKNMELLLLLLLLSVGNRLQCEMGNGYEFSSCWIAGFLCLKHGRN